MGIFHGKFFLTLFSCIVISTLALCVKLIMVITWMILLCPYGPYVICDINLKFGMPKDGKPNMLFVHCIRYGGRIFSVWYFLECFFFIETNMDKECNICSGRILSHPRTMKCVLCYNHCHLKCISLNSDERSNILRDTNCWYYHVCLSSVFAFNHIGDDSEFYKAICTKDIWNVDLLDLSDKVFNPLENLDRELNDLLDEYDPDLNFYKEIYQKSMHKCNYLTESSFKDYPSV